MSIKEIIIDSLTYSFSNWMNFLILGIFLLFSFSQFTVFYSNKMNFMMFICLNIIVFLFVGSFVMVYVFKIINESLSGANELPEFGDWNKMFIDGLKLFIVNFIYLIPVFLMIISLLRSSGSDFGSILTTLSKFNLDSWLFDGIPFFNFPNNCTIISDNDYSCDNGKLHYA